MGAVAKNGRDGQRVSPLLVMLVAVLVAVVGVGGFVAWQFFGTNIVASRAVPGELAAVHAALDGATPSADGGVKVPEPMPHEAAWLLRIPSLDLEQPIIAGVEPGDLRRGVGWYPGTALPGQVGNFVLAGYRFGNGEPFRHLFGLKVGDEVVVETPQAVFTYEVISAPGELTVQEGDSWVLDPVPGRSDEIPTQALLTLTTGEDVIETGDRAVGFAVLTGTQIR